MATASQPVNPRSADPQSIALETVQYRLAILWFVGSALVFVLVIYQSLAGVYADRVQDVWKWLLPTLMPTLTMIVTVAAANAFKSGASAIIVRKTFYRIAFGLSACYLGLILFVLLSLPAFHRMVSDQIESLHTSNLWIGPLQGIVASALGVLFASKKTPSGE
ncbi:hypothetical protein DYQ86_22900 [Acidobacteria bacterium AB60]|nr:hypothetical protein DYQ86_22900 [Acidobacteria bacterium AB60]